MLWLNWEHDTYFSIMFIMRSHIYSMRSHRISAWHFEYQEDIQNKKYKVYNLDVCLRSSTNFMSCYTSCSPLPHVAASNITALVLLTTITSMWSNQQACWTLSTVEWTYLLQLTGHCSECAVIWRIKPLCSWPWLPSRTRLFLGFIYISKSVISWHIKRVNTEINISYVFWGQNIYARQLEIKAFPCSWNHNKRPNVDNDASRLVTAADTSKDVAIVQLQTDVFVRFWGAIMCVMLLIALLLLLLPHTQSSFVT